MKFIKYYSLEIFTVISMGMMCACAFIDCNPIQKMAMAFLFVFVLHEWEEGHYPGGFLDYIQNFTGMHVGIDVQKGSRLYTGLYLHALTLVPFFFSQYEWLILPAVFLGFWEGFVHIMAIKLWRINKPYSPGMVTAEIEVLIGIGVVWYLSANHLVLWWHYIVGFLLMLVGFMLMQRALVRSTGHRYRDLPKMAKANLARMKNQ